MSIGALLIVIEEFARIPGPWLGRAGLGIMAALMVLIAGFVHHEQVSSYDVRVGTGDYVVCAVIVAAQVAAAMTRSDGRCADCPVAPRSRRGGAWRPGRSSSPPSTWCRCHGSDWRSTSRCSQSARCWSCSGAGPPARDPGTWPGSPSALLARTTVGFLAPLPAGTTWTGKLAQNVVYLLVVLGLGVALERRTRASRSAATGR